MKFLEVVFSAKLNKSYRDIFSRASCASAIYCDFDCKSSDNPSQTNVLNFLLFLIIKNACQRNVGYIKLQKKLNVAQRITVKCSQASLVCE